MFPDCRTNVLLLRGAAVHGPRMRHPHSSSWHNLLSYEPHSTPLLSSFSYPGCCSGAIAISWSPSTFHSSSLAPAFFCSMLEFSSTAQEKNGEGKLNRGKKGGGGGNWVEQWDASHLEVGVVLPMLWISWSGWLPLPMCFQEILCACMYI